MAAVRLASALALFVVLALPAPEATAVIHRNTNAGAACQPRYPGARAFAGGNHSLRNSALVAQYVVCHFPQLDIGDAAQPPVHLELHVVAGALAGKVVCVAQMAFHDGGVQASSTATRSAQVAPGGTAVLAWAGADLPREFAAHTLTLDCKVPAGFTLGFIRHADAEPAPGTGWTPPGT